MEGSSREILSAAVTSPLVRILQCQPGRFYALRKLVGKPFYGLPL